MHKITSRIIGLAAVAIIGLGALPGIASAKSEKHSGSFASTGVDDDANGGAKLLVKNESDGKFEIKGKRLDADATYDVLVDGVLVGQFTTNGGGSGRIRFRSRPHGSDLLLGFDPRGAVVVVRNAAGQDVLAMQIADDTSTADGDIICCIPDDSGPECEDRTADECALEGGVAVAATSCDPNPCASVTPPANDDVMCCLADDSGPECEDRTPAQCAIEGGTSAGVGVCAVDTCSAVPPPSGNATVTVKCEVRSNRSKVSVDGAGLAAGSYQAVATSGANTVTAPAHQTVGDEVEFDFDSDSGDIALGATAIASDFIQGAPPQVTGKIVTLSGGTVVEATVDCVVK